MRIWIDADACPSVIKEILFRAAERTQTPITLVANHALSIPPSKYITTLQVSHGFDVADNTIVQHMKTGDLIITADIPLAAEVIEHNGTALSPRGELYTPDNIKARLSMRNLMEELRGAGEILGGPNKLSQADRQRFASQLDKLLQQA